MGAKPPIKRGPGVKIPQVKTFLSVQRGLLRIRHQGYLLAWEICDTFRKCTTGSMSVSDLHVDGRYSFCRDK